jgi:phosphatidate cytidylyltransferase
MTQSSGGETGVKRGGPLGADFSVRAASAVVMAVAALGFAWVGGFPFLCFWFAASVGVVWEWHRLVGGERIVLRVLAGAVALLAASSFGLRSEGLYAALALIAGAAATGALADRDHRLAAAAGVFYAGAIAAGTNLLRASPEYGLAAILWVFGVVWGTDVMAYVGGRRIGGPKLWPRVSPGKTWSGTIVGVGAGALIGAMVAWIAAPGGASLVRLASLGVIVAAASQAGDLFESALKRRAGVKDSSHLIPGHGGLMDRLDGFTVAIIIAVAIAYMRPHGHWIASALFVG